MEFAHPKILWALAVLVPMTANYVWRTLQGGSTVGLSTVESLRRAPKTLRRYMRHLPFVLRCAAVAMVITALARPQSAEHNTRTDAEGIDIVMAIDVSTSMLARDFNPDRITAAKEVAAEFVAARPADRIGLVVFAGESLTQSPLTTDRATLQTLLARIRSGIIEDGTAIGNGLATSVNRLRESEAKSKVIILLTDGVNNLGQISPLMAAQIAKEYGIRVYTIGVGKRGKAPYPAIDIFGNTSFVEIEVEIDEDILRQIADETGGKYFRATDKRKLKEIYDEIDSLEKSKVEISEFTVLHEEFLRFALAALVLLALEFLTKALILNRLP